MKKIILTTSLLIFFSAAAFTQMNVFGVHWEVNIPTSGDYLTETSWSGGRVEYRHFLKGKDISVGLAMSWDGYDQYFSRQTYQKADGNSAITSDFVAHVYTLPLTATSHYYFARKGKVRPFAGLGLGAQYMEQKLYYNVYESDEYNWGFIARPEVGIFIGPPNSIGGINVSAGWSFATNKNGITQKDSFTNFSLTLGVLFGE
jgi:hypothetical protein